MLNEMKHLFRNAVKAGIWSKPVIDSSLSLRMTILKSKTLSFIEMLYDQTCQFSTNSFLSLIGGCTNVRS